MLQKGVRDGLLNVLDSLHFNILLDVSRAWFRDPQLRFPEYKSERRGGLRLPRGVSPHLQPPLLIHI
jgi:hypothetical protein